MNNCHSSGDMLGLFNSNQTDLSHLFRLFANEGRLDFIRVSSSTVCDDHVLCKDCLFLSKFCQSWSAEMVEYPWRVCSRTSICSSPFDFAWYIKSFFTEQIESSLTDNDVLDLFSEVYRMAETYGLDVVKNFYLMAVKRMSDHHDSCAFDLIVAGLADYTPVDKEFEHLLSLATLFTSDNSTLVTNKGFQSKLLKYLVNMAEKVDNDLAAPDMDKEFLLHYFSFVTLICDSNGLHLAKILKPLAITCNSYTDSRSMNYHCFQGLFQYSKPSILKCFLEYHVESMINDSTFNKGALHTGNQTKRLCSSKDPEDWMRLYSISCGRMSHFLDELLEKVLHLCKDGFFDIAVSYLPTPHYSKLKPLIALVAWTNCLSLTDAKFLVDVFLENGELSVEESLLDEACKHIAYETKLISWCLQKTMTLTSNKVFRSDYSISLLFQQLESKSVLYVLNKAKFLEHLSYEEVMDFLKTQPVAVGLSRVHENDTLQHDVDVFTSFHIIESILIMFATSSLNDIPMISNQVEGKFLENTNLKEEAILLLNKMLIHFEEIKCKKIQIETLQSLLSIFLVRGCNLIDKTLEQEIIDEPAYSLHSSMSSSLESFATFDGDLETWDRLQHKKISSPIQPLHSPIHGAPPLKMSYNITPRQLFASEENVVDNDNAIEFDHYDQHSFLDDNKMWFERYKEKLNNLISTHLYDYSFLVHHSIVGSILEFLTDAESRLSNSGELEDTELDATLMSMRNVIQEAKWRYELVKTALSHTTKTPLVHSFEATLFLTEPNSAPDSERAHNKERVIHPELMLPLMFSRPECLVYMALQTTGIQQAHRVIQVLNMKEDASALWVDFIDVISNSIDALTQISIPESKHKDINKSNDHFTRSRLDSIRLAAETGKISASVDGIVEDLFHHGALCDFSQNMSPQEKDLVYTSLLADLAFAGKVGRHVIGGLLRAMKRKLDSVESVANVKDWQGEFCSITQKMFEFVDKWESESSAKCSSNRSSNTFTHVLIDVNMSLPLDMEQTGDQEINFKNMIEMTSMIDSRSECQVQPSDNASLQFQNEIESFRSTFNKDTHLLGNSHSVKDYLGMLWKHVNTLTTLQLYYKQKMVSEGSASKQQKVGQLINKSNHPFIVLKEEITAIFERLLFAWNMSPARLDPIAQQVNVNLVKVIARHCGVKIFPTSSSHDSAIYQLLSIENPIVLNDNNHIMANEEKLTTQSPCVYVENLMRRAIEINKKSDNIVQLYNSPDFKSLVEDIGCMVYLDLVLLKEHEKAAFFINTFNLMFWHGVVLLNAGKLLNFGLQETCIRKKESYHQVMATPLGRLAFLQAINYKIGQAGLLSAYNIYWQLIVGDNTSSFFGKEYDRRNYSFNDKDQTCIDYFPKRVNKLSIFSLCFGSTDSPPFKLVTSEDCSTQIQSAFNEFIERTITIDERSLKITIPEFMTLHMKIFMDDKPMHKSTTVVVDEMTRLLQFLSNGNFLPKLEKVLNRIDLKLFSIISTPISWRCNYIDDVGRIVHGQENSLELHLATNPSDDTLVINSIAEPISKYVKETSPVAAAVIQLSLSSKGVQQSLMSLMKEEGQVVEFPLDHKDGSTSDMHPMKPHMFSLINLLERNKVVLKTLATVVRQAKFAGVNIDGMINYLLIASETYFLRPLSHTCHLFILSLINSALVHRFNSLMPVYEIMPYLFTSSIKCTSFLLVNTVLSFLSGPDANMAQHWRNCFILMIEDISLKGNMLLELYDQINLMDANALFNVVMESNASPSTKFKCQEKWKEMEWCSKVANMCLGISTNIDYPWTGSVKWQDVMKQLLFDPNCLAKFLLSLKSFDILDELIKTKSINKDIHQACLKGKLQKLLLSDAPLLFVCKYLDDINNRQMAAESCSKLVEDNNIAMDKIFFLLAYLTDNLQEYLSSDQLHLFSMTAIGIKLLRFLPNEILPYYIHLKHKPIFIIQQLFLNLKVDFASEMIAFLHLNVKEFHGYTANIASMLIIEVDEVLTKFASKALEISFKDGTFGLDETSITKTRTEDNQQVKNHSRTSSTASASSGNGSKPLITGEKAQTPVMDASSSPGSIIKRFPIQSSARSFSEWIKDDLINVCLVCNITQFGMFNRRHHCRHCGYVVCSQCSKHLCQVEGYTSSVRTCDNCFRLFYSQSASEAKLLTTVEGCRDAGDSFAEESTMEKQNSPVCINLRDLIRPSTKFSAAEPEFILSGQTDRDMKLIDEFCFDEAPSASLCLSILDMCNNTKACGGLLLKCCNDLSRYLKSSQQVEVKGEIDVHMITRIIEFLLFNAKVLFTKSGDSKGAGSCDTYVAHVEIIKVLLDANWEDIPTMQELCKPEATRRLRDRLIEEECFSVAIEITGKCGLDPKAVWFVMGMSELKSGCFQNARESFSKCMTASEAGKVLPTNLQYVETIISVLETSPLLSFKYQVDDIDFITSKQSNLKSEDFLSGFGMDRKRYSECMYYLKCYGSHSQIICFYIRNNLLKSACTYLQEKNCESKLFFDLVLLPLFHEGMFSTLLQTIKDLNPDLNGWLNHIHYSCKQLSRRGLFHCLYSVQLFIKDYFRAAMTCVKFFLGSNSNSPQTLSGLLSRMTYLDLAKSHIESLIHDRSMITFSKQSQDANVDVVPESRLKTVLSANEISNNEIKIHLSTIELQIKVMNFFSLQSRRGTKYYKDSQKIPTLFGKGKERAELVVELLSRDPEDSFSLASRIMQDYALPCLPIFTKSVLNIIKSRELGILNDFMRIIEELGMLSVKEMDDLLLQIVKELAKFAAQVKLIQTFIKKIKGKSSKVNAFLSVGRLRDAYLEAVKYDRVADVQRILQVAESTGQQNITDICRKWLHSRVEAGVNKPP